MSASQPKQIIAMELDEREALLLRAAEGELSPEDVDTIRAVFDSYAYVSDLIDQKSLSLARLRQMLFGARTEKTSNVPRGQRDTDPSADSTTDSSQGPSAGSAAADSGGGASISDAASAPTTSSGDASNKSNQSPQRRGHGRNGAEDFSGALRVDVPVVGLRPGDLCPACGAGTVYELNQPGVLIRLVGQPPVRATIFELQKLRCQACGKLFTAERPAAAGEQKYDATVGSMIGLLKYGHGFPFHRLATMQEYLDMPLAASTQWDLVALASICYQPAYAELLRQAAQGQLMHNDDTTARILQHMGRRAAANGADAASAVTDAAPATVDDEPALKQERTGLFTTGVVAECGAQRIALFFTGRNHAGENLTEVLRRRAAELPPPIQMCDALSRNYPAEFQTIVANCLAHARRKFIEVRELFDTQCTYVLNALARVYVADDEARKKQLAAEERLRYHQQESGPVMEELRAWLKRQGEERLVEPNSVLGAAIEYLRKHWDKLTLFLRVAGAPLDNNIAERALKKAILHRKNALFYRSDRGAEVGDLHMTLIHTCELCDANPFDYLTELQRHAAEVAATPAHWLPWNYRATLERLAGATANASR